MDETQTIQPVPPITEDKKITGFNGVNPEDRNKNGRPKKDLSMVDILKQELKKVDPKLKLKYKRIIAKQLVILASNGNTKALREVFDRIDGRPKQSVDVTTNGQSIINNELDRLGDLIDELSPNATTNKTS